MPGTIVEDVTEQPDKPRVPDSSPALSPQAAAPPVPVPALPVLSYEKPAIYRYKSDLSPPGVGLKLFWAGCFRTGRLFGLIYKPRPAPRLYTPKDGK
jgi:hypothetical protein